MIAGYFHEGSGLGNQLHRYVMTRVLARDKNLRWGMVNPQNFKGVSFMKLSMGDEVAGEFTLWNEKKVVENGVDIRPYDPEINFVQDNTIIDGEFQDERYFKHRMRDINDWLRVKYLSMPDDLCVIGFRGGEYKIYPDLFLPKEYWQEGIDLMKSKYPSIRFEVHTDDPQTAHEFFPDYDCIHDIGLNWRSVRYAKHLIIANSSFYIFPSLLNKNAQEIIAPRYWARYNRHMWALPQNYYRKFTYA